MKLNNFVIAGLGSSGTKFLAGLMNRSAQWHVVHMGIVQSFDMDGTTQLTAQPLLDARPRFFGDVNGLLLFHLLELRVGKKAVIIRDPRDTLLSWYCQAKGQLAPSFFSIYAGGYFALEECIEQGVKTIRFERMVSDPGYLHRVLLYFGIRDVVPTDETVRVKVNTKRTAFCDSYEAIDELTRRRFARASGDFARKYYGEGPVLHADDFLELDVSDSDAPDDGPELEEGTMGGAAASTRSTTLQGRDGVVVRDRCLSRSATVQLATRLGLGAPDDPAAPARLQEVRLSDARVTLVIVQELGQPHAVVLEPRRQGVPYFTRTRHLHISHAGHAAGPALLALIAELASRLDDVTFMELCPPEP